MLIALDGDHAAVTSDYLWLRSVDGVISPGLAGRYRDTLVHARGSWLITRRLVEPMSHMQESA